MRDRVRPRFPWRACAPPCDIGSARCAGGLHEERWHPGPMCDFRRHLVAGQPVLRQTD